MLFITTVCFAFLSCSDKKSEQVFTYPTGEVKLRIPLVNGKKQGEMLEYYRTGEILSRSNFTNDVQTGKAIYYYRNGDIQEVKYYKNNKLDQADTSFYENGNIELIVEYSDGLKNGYIKKFDTTGVMYFNAKYKMDTLVEVKGMPLQK